MIGLAPEMRRESLKNVVVNSRPLIDNVSRNHKPGLVFEFSVGEGSLLICTIDLLKLTNHPEAAQLLRSMLAYAGSEKCDPTATIDLLTLKRIMGILVVRE